MLVVLDRMLLACINFGIYVTDLGYFFVAHSVFIYLSSLRYTLYDLENISLMIFIDLYVSVNETKLLPWPALRYASIGILVCRTKNFTVSFIKKQYPFRQISVIRKSHYVVTLKIYLKSWNKK